MSVTPDFVGQIYKDTATGNLWRANSTTAGDWTLELQNLKLKWSPTSVDMSTFVGPGLGSDTLSTGYVIEATSIEYYLIISGESLVTSVSIPNCTDIAVDVGINYNPLLASVTAPLLETVDGAFDLTSNDITSFSFPSLTSVNGNLIGYGNATLTTVSLPLYLPTNGKDIDFENCALTEASVDHLLARAVANAGYVTGNIKLFGGTSSAPGVQGNIDKGVLLGRGVNVNTN